MEQTVQTNMMPGRACKRSGSGESAEHRRIRHRGKMTLKAARRPLLQPGFTPVRNERISNAITAMMLLVQLERPQLSAAEAQQEAIRRVASTLPPQRMTRSYRPRPSKNDDPAYRRGNR